MNAGSMQVFVHLGFGSVNEYGRGSLGLGGMFLYKALTCP